MPQCFSKLRPVEGETVGEGQELEEGSRWGKGFMVERIRARQSATSLLGAQARAGVWPDGQMTHSHQTGDDSSTKSFSQKIPDASALHEGFVALLATPSVKSDMSMCCLEPVYCPKLGDLKPYCVVENDHKTLMLNVHKNIQTATPFQATLYLIGLDEL